MILPMFTCAGAVTVIRAGSQEIEQHIVLIGRNNQMLDRQAQQLRIISGKNITEITGRYHELDLIANIDDLLFEQLRVSGEIVDDLRH